MSSIDCKDWKLILHLQLPRATRQLFFIFYVSTFYINHDDHSVQINIYYYYNTD